MTYSPTTWQTGDLITAALLNNTESQYGSYKTDYGFVKLTTGSSYVIYNDFTTAISIFTTRNYTKRPIVSFYISDFIQPSLVDFSIQYRQDANVGDFFYPYLYYGVIPSSTEASMVGSSGGSTRHIIKDWYITGLTYSTGFQTLSTTLKLVPGVYTLALDYTISSTSVTRTIYFYDLKITGSTQATLTSTNGSTGLGYQIFYSTSS